MSEVLDMEALRLALATIVSEAVNTALAGAKAPGRCEPESDGALYYADRILGTVDRAEVTVGGPAFAVLALRSAARGCPQGEWRAEEMFGAWVVQQELPCINGLSAWFDMAKVTKPDESEIGYTEGAIGSAKARAKWIAMTSPANILRLIGRQD